MEIKIALAADTMLYLPLYCIHDVYRPSDISVILRSASDAQPQLGDDGAYAMLQSGEADLCVCDPMVLQEEFRAGRRTTGVLIASLVTRTGLWSLHNASVKRQSPHISFINEIKGRGDVTISSILTYDRASTAGRVIDHLKQHDKYFANVQRLVCKFGEELSFLDQPYPWNGKEVRPDLVVTCDLCGALAKVQMAQPPGSIAMAIEFPKLEPYSISLFTGVIAHRGFLKNNYAEVRRLLESIQGVLDAFYSDSPTHIYHGMAQMLIRKTQLFPRSIWPENDGLKLRICEQALTHLREQEVLAKTIRLKEEDWKRQAEVWGFTSSADGDKGSKHFYFKECADKYLPAAAAPSFVVSQARRLRKYIVPVVLPLVLVVEVFHGVAALYHLYGWHPNKWFWISVNSIVVGVLFALWLFGLREDVRHS